MTQAKITSKGQITLPKAIRQYLNVDTGDSIEFFIDDNGIVNVLAKTIDISELYGILPAKKHVSIEDMKKAVQKEAAMRYKKSERN